MHRHIAPSFINMYIGKKDKHKMPKGPLIITKQSPKKLKVISLDMILQRSITHFIFADHMVVQMLWAQKNTKCSYKINKISINH